MNALVSVSWGCVQTRPSGKVAEFNGQDRESEDERMYLQISYWNRGWTG